MVHISDCCYNNQLCGHCLLASLLLMEPKGSLLDLQEPITQLISWAAGLRNCGLIPGTG